jgi:hypothetical protein
VLGQLPGNVTPRSAHRIAPVEPVSATEAERYFSLSRISDSEFSFNSFHAGGSLFQVPRQL